MIEKKITLHEQIKDVLRLFPSTRDDDRLLYIYWLQIHRPGYVNATFQTVMRDKTLPTIESVGRARRKCQELHPSLRATKETQAAREIEEQEYREYAREVLQ